MTPNTMYLTGIGLGLLGAGMIVLYLVICFLDWRARRWNERWRREMR